MIPGPRHAGDDEPASDLPGFDVTAMTRADLYRQRRLLADELRGVQYARRLTRAQTDLLVASLVYTGHLDLDGLHGIRLHDGDAAAFSPSGRLLLLRQRDRIMSAHERALRGELDAVTRELAARSARTPSPAGAVA